MLGFLFRGTLGKWAESLDAIEATFVYFASATLLIAGVTLEDDVYRERSLSAGQGFAILYLGLAVPVALVYPHLVTPHAAVEPSDCRSNGIGGIGGIGGINGRSGSNGRSGRMMMHTRA